MRPSIGWVWFVSAPICFPVVVWRNSCAPKSVRSVLGLFLHQCTILASIFFLWYLYRAVHLESWFCNLPAGGWSAYSKNTNSGFCSSPLSFLLIVLSHSSVFLKGNDVVACIVCVRETFYSLLERVIHGQGAGFHRNRCAPVWRTRTVCFKSNLLLNIQMYHMSSLHKYN